MAEKIKTFKCPNCFQQIGDMDECNGCNLDTKKYYIDLFNEFDLAKKKSIIGEYDQARVILNRLYDLNDPNYLTLREKTKKELDILQDRECKHYSLNAKTSEVDVSCPHCLYELQTDAITCSRCGKFTRIQTRYAVVIDTGNGKNEVLEIESYSKESAIDEILKEVHISRIIDLEVKASSVIQKRNQRKIALAETGNPVLGLLTSIANMFVAMSSLLRRSLVFNK